MTEKIGRRFAMCTKCAQCGGCNVGRHIWRSTLQINIMDVHVSMRFIPQRLIGIFDVFAQPIRDNNNK